MAKHLEFGAEMMGADAGLHKISAWPIVMADYPGPVPFEEAFDRWPTRLRR